MAKRGLYANIHAKRKRIKAGSKEKMTSRKFPYDGRSRPSDAKYKQNFDRIFNPTLVKNMPNVKWKEIPPVKGPDPQGVKSSSTISRKKI